MRVLPVDVETRNLFDLHERKAVESRERIISTAVYHLDCGAHRMREAFKVVLEFIGQHRQRTRMTSSGILPLALVTLHIDDSLAIGAIAQATARADRDAARVRHLLDQQDACARIVRLDGGDRSGKPNSGISSPGQLGMVYGLEQGALAWWTRCGRKLQMIGKCRRYREVEAVDSLLIFLHIVIPQRPPSIEEIRI